MITTNELVLLCTIDAMVRKRSVNKDDLLKLKPVPKGSYPFIPISTALFFKSILSIRELFEKDELKLESRENIDKRTFVDYGAGIGVTMYIAELLGFKCEGIEINEDYIRESPFYRYYTNSTGCLYQGDLTEQSTFTGKSYDVVYYYSPFCDYAKEIAFEIEALRTVKVGGYVIAPGPGRFESFFNNRKNSDTYNIRTENDRKFYNQMKNFKEIQKSIYQRIK